MHCVLRAIPAPNNHNVSFDQSTAFQSFKRSICLLSPLGKPADQAIYFTFRNFFFIFLLRAKLSQYLLDRFSRFFHQMEGICVNFLDLVQFFRFLLRDVPWQPILWQNCGKITYLLHLSLCRPEMGYRYLNTAQMMHIQCIYILYENFVKFGLVTPELTELICERQV